MVMMRKLSSLFSLNPLFIQPLLYIFFFPCCFIITITFIAVNKPQPFKHHTHNLFLSLFLFPPLILFYYFCFCFCLNLKHKIYLCLCLYSFSFVNKPSFLLFLYIIYNISSLVLVGVWSL
ncbi:hypothetical protein F4703DRAFT_1166929 [Phycomyces blakesleeanus]